jgi:hypothetical protein
MPRVDMSRWANASQETVNSAKQSPTIAEALAGSRREINIDLGKENVA